MAKVLKRAKTIQQLRTQCDDVKSACAGDTRFIAEALMFMRRASGALELLRRVNIAWSNYAALAPQEDRAAPTKGQERMSDVMTGQHLWEPEHPYYCSEGNYFSNECHADYRSWAEFMEEDGLGDPDLNLVFRWDWDAEHRELSLFFVGQRRALLRSVHVTVVADDEPAVREWLTERAKTLAAMWQPISLAAPTETKGEA